MGVPKGTDNFKAHRTSKVSASVELLRSELAKARKRKMPYPDKKTLVADMAERTKIHRTTLGRNPAYQLLILKHLGMQAGGSSIVADKDAPRELLLAKLVDAQMEIGRLTREVQKAHASTRPGGDLAVMAPSAAHAAFSDTVWVLREVVERINEGGETLVVDLQRGEIRDLAAPNGREVVVGGARVRSFLDAYKRLLDQEGGASGV